MWKISCDYEPGIHTPDSLRVRAEFTPSSDHFPKIDFWFDLYMGRVLLPHTSYASEQDAVDYVREIVEEL